MANDTETLSHPPRMPYEWIRSEIRSGDLLLCQGTSSFAQMIQLATKSPWSHVGCILRADQIDRIFVFESVESVGVQNGPLSHYLDNYDETGRGYPGRIYIARHAHMPSMSPAQIIRFWQQAVDLQGRKYANKEIAGIALRILADRLGAEPRLPSAPRRPLICSEFAACCFTSVGITIPYNRLNYIAPDDFATCPDVQLLWELDTTHG